MALRVDSGLVRHLDFVDWKSPSVTPRGHWIDSQCNRGDPNKRLDIMVTIPPTESTEVPEYPFHRPLIVFFTGSANDHLQETLSAKKCPQQRYCRKPGLRWALQQYVIVSVAWDKSKRKGFNTGPPNSVIDLFTELSCRFTNIYKRFLIGFSRGAMGVIDCQISAPYFAQLHVVIAPYYPSCEKYPARHPVHKVSQSYVDSRVDLWYIYGEDDEWLDEVVDLREKLCSQQLLRDHLLDEVMLRGMDHDSSFAYLMYNPGTLWHWLEQRILDTDLVFNPEETARNVRGGANMYPRHAAMLAETERRKIRLQKSRAAACAQNHQAWEAYHSEVEHEAHAASRARACETAHSPEELGLNLAPESEEAGAQKELHPSWAPTWNTAAGAPEDLPPARAPTWDARTSASEELHPVLTPAWQATGTAEVRGQVVDDEVANIGDYSDDGDEVCYARETSIY